MSYSNFSYTNLNVSAEEVSESNELTINADVKNEGNIDGMEVVQLYPSDLYVSVNKPNKQTKGFEKNSLNHGATKTVTFKLNKEHLSFIGKENKKIVEVGEIKVTVEKHTMGFKLN